MTEITAGLIQEQTGVFAKRMQGRHLYILRYSANIFGNSASILIAILGLSGYSNGYQATVAIARNIMGASQDGSREFLSLLACICVDRTKLKTSFNIQR